MAANVKEPLNNDSALCHTLSGADVDVPLVSKESEEGRTQSGNSLLKFVGTASPTSQELHATRPPDNTNHHTHPSVGSVKQREPVKQDNGCKGDPVQFQPTYLHRYPAANEEYELIMSPVQVLFSVLCLILCLYI